MGSTKDIFIYYRDLYQLYSIKSFDTLLYIGFAGIHMA